MKRNKHITVNINEDQYKMLIKLSDYYKRSISELCYLLLSDDIESLFIKMNNELFKDEIKIEAATYNQLKRF